MGLHPQVNLKAGDATQPTCQSVPLSSTSYTQHKGARSRQKGLTTSMYGNDRNLASPSAARMPRPQALYKLHTSTLAHPPLPMASDGYDYSLRLSWNSRPRQPQCSLFGYVRSKKGSVTLPLRRLVRSPKTNSERK